MRLALSAAVVAISASSAYAQMPAREPVPGDPYKDVREMMIARGYQPQPQINGCAKTAWMGDYRCRAFPEFHMCDVQTPATCVAEWKHPKGYRLIIYVQGYDLLTFRQAGRPE